MLLLTASSIAEVTRNDICFVQFLFNKRVLKRLRGKSE
ncbi:hypothetical protein BTJ48_03200 [Bacillus mycoides]|nr:hypothetical protein BTJ48_03200 [Bacillus mycoides]